MEWLKILVSPHCHCLLLLHSKCHITVHTCKKYRLEVSSSMHHTLAYRRSFCRQSVHSSESVSYLEADLLVYSTSSPLCYTNVQTTSTLSILSHKTINHPCNDEHDSGPSRAPATSTIKQSNCNCRTCIPFACSK